MTALASPLLRAYLPLPIRYWVITGVVASLFLLTSNPLVSAASVLALPFIGWLTWRVGEPPVLAFACAIQWLQATAELFTANFQNVPLTDYGGDELVMAVWLSLVGVVVVAMGMRVALRGLPYSAATAAAREVSECSVKSLFKLYLAAYVVCSILTSVSWVIPQLTQVIVALEQVKWVVIVLFGYAVLQRRQSYELLLMMVAIELATGLVSYFSSFTRVLIVLMVLAPAAGIRFNTRMKIGAAAIVAFAVAFAVVWSAIKPEYRSYVNRGTGDQEVYVSSGEALEKAGELFMALDADALSRGVDALVRRIGYVDFFAAAINHVPAVIPYQDGEIWFAAVGHVLQPRLLFPNKPDIDDSEQTRRFTGISVAGAEAGTSISLGYFAESYIDFGPVGMFVPIFIMGLLWGGVYRLFVFQSRFKSLGFAIATAILSVYASNVGMAGIKIVGGTLTSVIVLFVVRTWLLSPLLVRLGFVEGESGRGLAEISTAHLGTHAR